MPTGMLGALLISAIGEIMPNGPFIVPDIAWDGVLDPARGDYPAADKICITGNGDADYINLAWPLNEGDAAVDGHGAARLHARAARRGRPAVNRALLVRSARCMWRHARRDAARSTGRCASTCRAGICSTTSPSSSPPPASSRTTSTRRCSPTTRRKIDSSDFRTA